MLTTEELIFFSAIAGEHSLAAAARRLNVTASAVTQRLKALEAKVGLRLTQRNGRALLLTDEGEMLAKVGVTLIAELAQLDEALLTRRDVVAGPLRVIAPFGFGRRFIAPLCMSFRDLYPGVTIDLQLSDRMGRYPERSFDLAIHIGELSPSGLKVRTVARNRRYVCASPKYLESRSSPKVPADLRSHQILVLRENDEDATLWKFKSNGNIVSVRVEATMSSNDGELIRQWAMDGQGIMIRSEWDVSDDIAKGRLVRLLPSYPMKDADVVVLVDAASEQRLRTAKFMKHLVQSLSPPPWR